MFTFQRKITIPQKLGLTRPLPLRGRVFESRMGVYKAKTLSIGLIRY